MKKAFFSLSVAALFLAGSAWAAGDLDALAGKWSFKKVTEQGQKVTQTVEIKKDKFIFQIIGSDDSILLHAEGDVKLEKLGPFSSARFFHIRAGDSATNLQDVDEEYVSVYSLDGDTWTMASNFDKQRDQQKPSLDLYQRVKPAAAPKSSK